MKWINLERFDHFCKYHYRKWDETLFKGAWSLLKICSMVSAALLVNNNQKRMSEGIPSLI